MAKAKTQIENTPSLFDVFDYYDDKGELQNDVLNPDNRAILVSLNLNPLRLKQPLKQVKRHK